jgi:uncharacterized pyridoxamine 5'-phosphate oxidase family protein
MELKEATDFANANPVAYLATCDGDTPHVRAFRMWFADETGFYFHMGSTKAVCRQLMANPKIELCYWTSSGPGGAGRMLRVAGEIEFMKDASLEARLFKERPILKGMHKAFPDTELVIFRLAHGEAHFWTMEMNLREAEIERVRF